MSVRKGKFKNVIEVLEKERLLLAKVYQLYVAQEESDYWWNRLNEVDLAIKHLKCKQCLTEGKEND